MHNEELPIKGRGLLYNLNLLNFKLFGELHYIIAPLFKHNLLESEQILVQTCKISATV